LINTQREELLAFPTEEAARNRRESGLADLARHEKAFLITMAHLLLFWPISSSRLEILD
jgi:hypothetical protein